MNELYDIALAKMTYALDALAVKVTPPKAVFDTNARGFWFRYPDQTLKQALIQKMARVISGLHAARLLLLHGFIQEQSSLHRMLDEFEEDILFLSFAEINQELTDAHKNYLKWFYQEEYADPDRPMETRVDRPSVPRKKIHAYLARSPGFPLDISAGSAVSGMISKAYSGYVHGASPHTMEMYDGKTRRFQVAGMKRSPFWIDHSDDVYNYILRGIFSFAFAAKAFNDDALFTDLHFLSKQLEQAHERNLEN